MITVSLMLIRPLFVPDVRGYSSKPSKTVALYQTYMEQSRQYEITD